MSTKAPSYSRPDPHAIAILGMSIAAPGGENAPRGLDTEAFYEFLKSRGSGVITVPSDRWNASAFHGNGPGKICTTKGGFIPEYSYGDLQEFGITPAEAAQVQTLQIVLLHQAFSALQRSGINYRGTTTGVYIGCAGGDSVSQMDITQAGPYYMTGTSLSIAANRINYVFDLLGPSMPVDTACSSSLVAMHLAVQAIRNGECDQAVVAGANFIDSPLETVAFSQLGVLSPDGISKSFDEAGNGYARGDIASAVVIKRHDLAVRDWDRIIGTLVGTALTSCGSLMGSLTTPNPEAQAAAIRNAYRDAGLEPHQVDFVELHGTGTVVGDSLEANSAGALFSQGRGGREIVIGSVKSNVGHGEMGAYMSSLVKVVMMLEKRQILPNGYFHNPSSRIDFKKYNLRVPVESEDFVPYDPEQGLIASISSYGFGGSCGHTVLRQHDARPTHQDAEALQSGPFLFAFGALSPKAANTLIQQYREQYINMSPFAVSAHLGSRARQLTWRTFSVADSLQSATFPDPVLVGKRPNPLIYCFSGQGPQHWQQGRGLMATYSVFRNSVLECDKLYKEYTGESCIEKTGLFIINPSSSSPLAESLIWPAEVISVAITFFQIAMFDLLTSFGLKPDAIVGHSIGETAVLYASGAMPRDMVVQIAIARGRALSKVDGTGGTMVALSGSDVSTVRDHIEAASALADIGVGESGHLYMAAFNSPTDIGVSGSESLVDLLAKYIETWVDGVMARKLRVSTAVHSPFVDPCEVSYRAELADIFSKYPGPFVPSIPTMSTVTATFKSDEYTIDYLWRNLRQPVLFSTAIPGIVEKFGENTTFVEISPHPVLSQYIKKMGAFDSLACATRPPSARHLKPGSKHPKENQTLLETLGQLLTYGINSINFSVLNGCPSTHVEDPVYPFHMKFYPFANREPAHLRNLLPPTRPLNSLRLRVSPVLPEPWVSHHIIDHSNLIPAAVYVEMALEFPKVTQVWDVKFEAACIVEENVPPVTLEVKQDGINWTVKSSSVLQSPQGDFEWTRTAPEFDIVHAHGKLGYGKPNIGYDSIIRVDVRSVLARCVSTYYAEELTAELSSIVQFGPEFTRIKKACVNATEAICYIKGHADGLNTTDYAFHPALMDAVFQSFMCWNMLFDRVADASGKHRNFMLPHSLYHGYRNDGSTTALVLPEEFRIYAVLIDYSPYSSTLDAYVLAEDDTVIFTFKGLKYVPVNQDEKWPTERFMMNWQPRALPRTSLAGTFVTQGPSDTSETFEILSYLDSLAIQYTRDTLSSLPANFGVSTPDRRRYLAWAQEQVRGLPAHMESCISNSLREKYSSLLELTDRVGRGQKDILSSSGAAVKLLFRDNLMSKIYEHPPFTGSIFDQTVEQFINLVKIAFAAGKRVVRVLEVGAGTGRLTALLGQALVDADFDIGCYVDYVSSDISISLAQESTAKSPWPAMTPVALDLGVPLDQQKLNPASFDIIVAFDVLHAIPDVQHTLTTLRELLLPGGHIAIIELDGNSFSKGSVGTLSAADAGMDFIFGSFAEWMGVLEHRPGSSHCSLSPPDWRSALEATGFRDIMILSSSGSTISHMSFISQVALDLDYGYTSSSPSLSSSVSVISTPASCSPEPHTPAHTPVELKSLTIFSPTSDCVDSLPYDATKVVESDTETDARLQGIPTGCLLDNGLNTVRGFSSGGEVELVQFLSHLDSNESHTVWLHTSTDTSNQSLIGLVRSIRHEFALWKIMLVLFHPSWPVSRREAFIYDRLLSLKWVDAEVLVGENGNMHVPRVVAAPAPSPIQPCENSPIEFSDNNVWRAYPAPLDREDVEVSVSFVNLSSTFTGCCEFSGVVTAVGDALTRAEHVGKRVFGVARCRPGSIVICHRLLVGEVPAGMHMSIAAAIAGRTAFVSSVVVTALPSLASRCPKVLLHAGSWSPSAIATFSYLKAQPVDIMVTVGDRQNRLINIESLSPDIYTSTPSHLWSFRVRKWAPSGVDVAFNFDNSPDVARETVELLSKRGSFVQIGSVLPQQVKCGQRYTSVDFDALLDTEDLMSSASALIESSSHLIASPSVDIFHISQLSLAQIKLRFTHTSAADCAVLIDPQVVDPKLPVYKGGVMPGTAAFDPRASYFVIGGVGGLGVNLARCLIENGARHVVLTSRSGPKAFEDGKLIREKKLIHWLRNIPGVRLDILAVDCLDSARTKEMFETASRRIAGVFYLAVRLNDQLFANLNTEEDWKIVYDVKVKGLKILVEAVNPKCLDFLILTSSMATVSGSPGQANYSAAQTEMEALGSSLPNTISIAVPPIIDGGIFVRSMPTGNARSAALDKYTSLGMMGFRLAKHCVDAIWSLDLSRKYPLYIPPIDWQKVAELGSPDYCASSFRHLLVKKSMDISSTNSPTVQTIRGACATVLSMDVDTVETNIPLSSYGLDSLTSVRLSGILKQHFGIVVTQLQLLSRYVTVERLEAMQLEQRNATTVDSASSEDDKSADETTVADDIDQTIVRLNSITDGEPLFMLHGAGGGILVLQKVAQKVQCPVYGIQDTPEAPLTGTIERLSQFYLAKIREKQPEGPYRLAGFSFGTAVAYAISQILQSDGEKVEVLIMLDGAPSLFHRPQFREHIKKRISDNSLFQDIMDVVNDMAASGCLDGASEIPRQFADHLAKMEHGSSGTPWVARFCKAYAAHILMGVRATAALLRGETNAPAQSRWPAVHTVLVRADRGMAVEPYSEGASWSYDLDQWTSEPVEVHELQGSHFGILNPISGVGDVINNAIGCK